MVYDSIVTYSGTASLILFVAMFLCVLAYAFWPGNQGKFEQARLIPLKDNDNDTRGGENVR